MRDEAEKKKKTAAEGFKVTSENERNLAMSSTNLERVGPQQKRTRAT
jgi:hypothetical protein